MECSLDDAGAEIVTTLADILLKSCQKNLNAKQFRKIKR